MKKIFTLFSVISAMLLFSACGLKSIMPPPKPALTGAYSTSFTACVTIAPLDENSKEEEFIFGGKIKRLGGGFWEMSLDTPETLAGMKLFSSDDGLTSDLDGLKLEAEKEDLPEKSPAAAVFTALDNMAVRFDSGAALSPGEKEGYSFQSEGISAVFDQNGVITSLALASPKMTVEFSGFEEITGSYDRKDVSSETVSSQTVTTVIYRENRPDETEAVTTSAVTME